MNKYDNEKSTGVTKTFTPADFSFLKKSITMEIFVTTDDKYNFFIGRFDPLYLIVTAPRLSSLDTAFHQQMEISMHTFLWTEDKKLSKTAIKVKRLLKNEYVTDDVLNGIYQYKYFDNPALPPMSEKLRTYNTHAAWLKTVNKSAAAKYLVEQLKKHGRKK